MFTEVILLSPFLVGSCLTKSINAMELRLGFVESPPDLIVTYDEDNQTVLDGLAFEMLKWISSDLKFRYKFIRLNSPSNYAEFEREFINKSIDLCVPFFSFTGESNNILTRLFPWDLSEHTLLIPFPKYKSDPWSCFKPFSYIVWALILTSMTTLSLFLKLTGGRKGSNFTSAKIRTRSPKVDTFYVIGVITNQGGYCSSKVRSISRMTPGLWCIGALVLVNAYAGSLIQYLASLKIFPVVNTIEEMATRDDLQLLAPDGWYIRILLMGAEGNLKPLATNIARVPADLCGSDFESKELDDCYEKVKNGDHVLSTDKAFGYLAIDKDFRKTGKCSLTLIEQSFFPIYGGFVLSPNKSHDFRNPLDLSQLKAVSYGLAQKWKNQYYPSKGGPCTNYRSQPQTLKKLSLANMTGAFVILGFGYVISSVAFICELMQKKFFTNCTPWKVDLL